MITAHANCVGEVTGDTVLEVLKEARVLTVKQVPGGFRFRERCDRYYQIVLTREQVLALADELRALVEKQPEQS